MTACRRVPNLCLLSALLAGALGAGAGCGPGLPRVYPVTGKVVFKGKGPATTLAGYSVQLLSAADPAETPGGPVKEDGTFTLYTRVGGKVIPGVKEGTYQACLLPPAVEGGAPPPLRIPQRYTKPDTSTLQYTIAPGPNDLTIEVEPAPR